MSDSTEAIAVLMHHVALTQLVTQVCVRDPYAHALAFAAIDQTQRAAWLREWFCDDGSPARSMAREVSTYLRESVDWINVGSETIQAAHRARQNR